MKVHHGHVPSTLEDLEALPGVGHKAASVVMIHAFGYVLTLSPETPVGSCLSGKRSFLWTFTFTDWLDAGDCHPARAPSKPYDSALCHSFSAFRLL